MKKTAAILMLLTSTLAGCASYSAVNAGKAAPVGDGISIQPQIQWANAAGPGIDGTVWTVDGLGLNELRFMTGVTPGQPLLDITGVKKADLVPYQANMLPDDISEMTVSTLGRMNYAQTQASNLRPSQFGSSQGFRFDLHASRDGLEIKGIALGAQRNGKLDLILFLAPAEFYFERYEPAVEKIYASISLAPK